MRRLINMSMIMIIVLLAINTILTVSQHGLMMILQDGEPRIPILPAR